MMASGSNARRVVIVGGGPAGAAVAIKLARHGLQTVVLEAQHVPERKVGECLPPTANPILQELGLDRLLQRDGHLPSYGNRSVWGAPEPVERDFIFGTQGHGWQVDRPAFEAALAARACEEGAHWQYGYQLVKCSRLNGRWKLFVRTAEGHHQMEADFVVDATGRPALLARQFGARQIRYDRLIGVALLMTPCDGGGIKESMTLVEAVASGWWYSARLPGDRLMVVHLTDSDLVNHTEARRTSGWLALLEETDHTMRRVRDGGYAPLTEPRILPANSSRLDVMAGDNWLAVGDAAAAFDPLSSYGISAAMGGGFYAASAIVDYLTGSRDALLAYTKIVDQAYAQYLTMRDGYYSLEQRWSREPFWQRRHAPHWLRQEVELVG